MSAMADGPMDGEIELVPTGPPRTLKATFWATVVWSAISVLAILALFAEQPRLRNDLKGTKKGKNYSTQTLHDSVHKSLIIGLVETLLVVVILLLLAQLAWRGRPWARWALIGMATVPGVLFGVGVIGQLASGTLQPAPTLYKVPTIAAGFASLVVIVLLVHRDTRAYFTAILETKRGTLPQVTETATRPRGPRGARSAQAGPPPAAIRGPASTWAPRTGGLGGLFRKSMGTAPTVGPPAADSPDTAGPNDPTPTARPGGAPARRTSATRPGSVKAKGSGTRPGRSKSRQQ